jgi:hypothetical protein
VNWQPPSPVELTRREHLGPLLTRLGLLGLGAELGVHKGEFAETILHDWPGSLILVDTWRHMDGYLDSWNVNDAEAERNLEEARNRLACFGDRAAFWRMESGEAATRVQDGHLDFVYIDANHAYDAVRRDLALWYPKVRSGGLVSGHDYFDARADRDLEPDLSTLGEAVPSHELTSYGVQSAVDAFAHEHGYIVQTTNEELPTWYFLKR